MNNREFYRDILNGESVADFEEAVLRRTVSTARRVRRMRIAGRGAVVALVVGLAALQFWPRRQVEMVKIVSAPPKPSKVVLSHTVVKTQPFTGGIRTFPLAADRMLTTTSANVIVLKTGEAAAGEVRLINDEQLLSFFPGKAVALLHRGPHDAELVLLEGEE